MGSRFCVGAYAVVNGMCDYYIRLFVYISPLYNTAFGLQT